MAYNSNPLFPKRKECTWFDPSLMSGSADTFRTAIGTGIIGIKDPTGKYGIYLRPVTRSPQQAAADAYVEKLKASVLIYEDEISNMREIVDEAKANLAAGGRSMPEGLVGIFEKLDDGLIEKLEWDLKEYESSTDAQYDASYATDGSAGAQARLAALDPHIYSYSQMIDTMMHGGIGELEKFRFHKGSLMPIVKFASRIYGNPHTIDNDLHWLKYIYGGKYGDNVYKGLFSSQEFFKHHTTAFLPYTTKERRLFEQNIPSFKDTLWSEANISYEYNRYYRDYEAYVAKLKSERLIPSLYMLQSFSELDYPSLSTGFSLATVDEKNLKLCYDENSINYISRMEKLSLNYYSNILKSKAAWASFVERAKTNAMAGTMDIETSITRESAVFNAHLQNYLEGVIPNHPVPRKVDNLMDLKSRNVLFDRESLSLLGSAEVNRRFFPYYAKIKIPIFNYAIGTDQSQGAWSRSKRVDHFGQNFDKLLFDSKLLVSLKEVFGQKPSYLKPNSIKFIEQKFIDAQPKNKNSISQKNYRMTDLGILLNRARMNYINTKNDFCFIGRKDIPSRRTAMDKVGFYRYDNTTHATWALSSYLDFADNSNYLRHIAFAHEWLGKNLPKGSPQETIAWRIEKIGGPPTGDSKTRNVIQNFWFSNSTELLNESVSVLAGLVGESESSIISGKAGAPEFRFYDTQVKYGEQYTYNIYYYNVVAGSKYKIDGQRLTRKIAESTESRFGQDRYADSLDSINNQVGKTSDIYCLEFYDPASGDAMPALYYGGEKKAFDFRKPDEFHIYNPLLLDKQDFITSAQFISTNQYAVDFTTTVTPSIKIVEIPVMSKTIRILDTPPNKAQALPLEVDNDSNKIGFDIEYTPYQEASFPPMISVADKNYREHYMNSNDLLRDTYMPQETMSEPRFLEIYRTDRPPRSYDDFDGRLHKRVDLKIKDSNYCLKEHVYYDKIDTNKNYYYTFRFVNEHNHPGHPSLIHMVNLRDDGGYKYPIFEIYDFNEQKAKMKSEKTTDSFKKLVSIGPNLQHLTFDENSYNTKQTSTEALKKIKIGLSVDKSAIWNKKFKFRLTSKKTGKKVDLNITYNIERE